MIKLKQILLGEVVESQNPLDGKSKTNASNWVHSKVNKFTRGKFSDEYWKPIQRIYKEFDAIRLNWTLGIIVIKKMYYTEEW